jgi:hypothetical protein
VIVIFGARRAQTKVSVFRCQDDKSCRLLLTPET